MIRNVRMIMVLLVAQLKRVEEAAVLWVGLEWKNKYDNDWLMMEGYMAEAFWWWFGLAGDDDDAMLCNEKN